MSKIVCPACDSTEDVYYTPDAEGYCRVCGLRQSPDIWNRLGRASALLRAVEWLGARRDVADVPPFGAMRGEEIHLMPIQGSEEWAAASGGKLTSYCNTLADTIVALAKGLGYTEEPAP